jgi:hypothetical protein
MLESERRTAERQADKNHGRRKMENVDATPAKRFFVEMLIRDIELKDALLDLLDNCVDGAMRSAAKHDEPTDKPFAGRWAKIVFDANSFSIEDNCGGIPPDIAEASAFRLGRLNNNLDADLPTVGVYGIGMKRAVFKIGKHAVIDSNHANGRFTVTIDKAWMENDSQWKLPVEDGKSALDHNGTSIKVTELRDGISRLFSGESGFVNDLKTEISNYYGYILEKGFSVSVNGEDIATSQVSIVVDKSSYVTGKGIAPYLYETEQDGVEISVTVGFYRELPSADEEDEALAGRPSTERAGITIICNDRVVTYADKTRLTGWGTGTVPAYHTQFVSIAGVVVFRSNDASKLPLTTTKRGLDANTDLYLGVREVIQEGLKYFTDFTNKWKNASVEKFDKNATAVAPKSIAAMVPTDRWTAVHKGLGGRKYKPQLPLPANDNPVKQIRFSRTLADIRILADHFFEDKDTNPATVGARCFDDALAKAKK